MSYYWGCNNRMTSNSKHSDEKADRQIRVRCYTCNVRKTGRSGECIHYINNACPHGYRDEEKEFLNDLLMEQQEQM